MVRILDEALVPLAYAFAERFCSYPILVIIAVGTYRYQRRKSAVTGRMAEA
jgi:hypothetical protein